MKLLDLIARAGLATENFPVNCHLIIYGSFDVSWQPDSQINKSIVRLWYFLSPYHQLLDLVTFIFTLVNFTVAHRQCGTGSSAAVTAQERFYPRTRWNPCVKGPQQWNAEQVFLPDVWTEWNHRNIFGKNLLTSAIFVPWASPSALCRCISSAQMIPCSFFPTFFRKTTHMLNWTQTCQTIDIAQVNEYCKFQITRDCILGNCFSLPPPRWVD